MCVGVFFAVVLFFGWGGWGVVLLCRRMNIVDGPDEFIRPKNVGLLFFNDKPHEFFRQARIDVVVFKDSTGDSFIENIFRGPLKQQVVSALNYIANNVLQETVRKVPEKAEAIRFFNYPFQAIEEALVNAVYHKSYETPEPVEVRIEPDRIEILSFPGPVPPLNKNTLMDENVTSRSYRNRRIGDLFKELHLTEGRNTGFRKIRNAMKTNGSPAPVFKTDDERSYFLTVLPIHPAMLIVEELEGPVGGPVEGQVEAHDVKQLDVADIVPCLSHVCPKSVSCEIAATILILVKDGVSISDLMSGFGYTNRTRFRNDFIKPLMDADLLEMTIPDKPQSRNQMYKTTGEGLDIITGRCKE